MNTPRIFRLQGTAVTPNRNPIQNLRLAIVDKDTLLDDLLGVGFTDQKGQFRISFTSNEFNQDFFESETLPNIYIVFSRKDPVDGKFKTIYQQSFLALSFAKDTEDLGNIEITTWQEPPCFLQGVNATPGYHKKVQRLNLNDELVQHCLEEIAPLVEHLTGWYGSLENLTVKVVDDISPYIEDYGEGAQEEDLILSQETRNKIVASFTSPIVTIYEPIQNLLVIHRKEAAAQNLDALKVILGRELVKVAHFKAYPHLRDKQKQYQQQTQHILRNQPYQSLTSAEFLQQVQKEYQKIPFAEHLSKLEGYSYYIQADFLEKHYNMATYFYHASIMELLLKSLLPRLVPSFHDLSAISSSEYFKGMKPFHGEGKGGRPVRFIDFP